MTYTSLMRLLKSKHRVVITIVMVVLAACAITWCVVYVVLPANTLRSAKANPSKPLTVREYSRLKEYFESGRYKIFTNEDRIRDISDAALERAKHHNDNLYQFALDRYTEDPIRWQILIPLATEAINERDTGADFILHETRAIAHEPAIESLNLHDFAGHDVDILLQIALFLGYESSELTPHTELLKGILDRDDLTPPFRDLIRQKLGMSPSLPSKMKSATDLHPIMPPQ